MLLRDIDSFTNPTAPVRSSWRSRTDPQGLATDARTRNTRTRAMHHTVHNSFGALLVLLMMMLPPLARGDGLVGYWKFNEGTGTSTADASLSGNSGSRVGSTSWVSGQLGNAVDFSGGYVSMGAPANLANLHTSGMTVMAWIRPLSVGRIVDKDNNGYGWFLTLKSTSTIQFRGSVFSVSSSIRTSTSSIVLNTWQHVVATWDGSATGANIHLYLNGVLVDGTAVNGSGAVNSDAATPLTIGNRPIDLGASYDGAIDEVQIYNRVLSATEIQNLANPSGDTQAPSVPGGLGATATSSTQVALNWTASTDNAGVTAYLLERCQDAGCSTFSQIAAPTSNTYNNSGLSASTTYRYRVRSQDASGNLSGYSSVVTVATPGSGDTQAPSVPAGLTATAVSGTQIDLAWTASTDNVGVVEYLVESCQGAGCASFGQIGTTTTTTYSHTGLTTAATYRYRIRARDAANNLSGYSTIVSATAQAPPTAPTALSLIAVSDMEIDLGWSASTGGTGVTGYRIERCQGAGCSNFAEVGTSSTTTFFDPGRTAATTYGYRVRAVDSSSALSGYSNIVSASTLVTSTCD